MFGMLSENAQQNVEKTDWKTNSNKMFGKEGQRDELNILLRIAAATRQEEPCFRLLGPVLETKSSE